MDIGYKVQKILGLGRPEYILFSKKMMLRNMQKENFYRTLR